MDITIGEQRLQKTFQKILDKILSDLDSHSVKKIELKKFDIDKGFFIVDVYVSSRKPIRNLYELILTNRARPLFRSYTGLNFAFLIDDIIII
jgi:hypothetical protein